MSNGDDFQAIIDQPEATLPFTMEWRHVTYATFAVSRQRFEKSKGDLAIQGA